MKITQLSIFIENKAGRLREVTALLAEHTVNIRALALADTSDFGVLRIIVDDTPRALGLLKDAGFVVGETNIVAAEVPDRPGGLNHVLEILEGAGINVEYMYGFVERSGDKALLVLRIEDDCIPRAVETLTSADINVLKEADISQL